MWRGQRQPGTWSAVCAGALAGALITLTLSPSLSEAAPGDIYVADEGAPDTVHRIGAAGGPPTVISSGAPYGQLQDVTVSPATGQLFLADANAFPAPDFLGALFRLEQAGGTPATLPAGTLVTPVAAEFEPDGKLLVVDQDTPDPNPGGVIYRIDLQTGARTTVVSGPPLSEPWGVVETSNGDIYVIDQAGGPPVGTDDSGALFRIPAGTTTVTTLIAGPPLMSPTGLARQPDGKFVISDPDANIPGFTGGLFRFDPATGVLTTIASGPPLLDNYGVAIQPDGGILVTDESFSGQQGEILRFPPNGGAPTPVASGPPLDDPIGVTIDPPTCRGLRATIVGSTGPDILDGSPFADVIVGLEGADRINAVAGNDLVCGGAAKDRLVGGAGKDRLLGEAGKDKLFGKAGKDKLIGGKGKDKLIGGKGKDNCVGGKGADRGKACEKGKV